MYPSRQSHAHSTTSSASSNGKRTRAPQEIQVFQTMFHKEKVQEKYNEACKGKDMSKADRLALLKGMTREIYESETDEVKEAVHTRMREIVAERVAAQKAEASSERSTTQYEK